MFQPIHSDLSGLRLVRPTLERKIHYVEALRDFKTESLNPEAIADEILTVNEYIARQQGNELGYMDYWLVDREICYGTFQLRPTDNSGSQAYYDVRPSYRCRGFGTATLSLGLNIAKNIGMSYLYLAAEVGNVWSRKIIVRNGGHLIIEQKKDDRVLAYYMIELT